MMITRITLSALIGTPLTDYVWAKFLEKSCLCKTRYKTKKNAKHASKRLAAKIGRKVNVYQCSNCLGYHLTSKEYKNNAS